MRSGYQIMPHTDAPSMMASVGQLVRIQLFIELFIARRPCIEVRRCYD